MTFCMVAMRWLRIVVNCLVRRALAESARGDAFEGGAGASQGRTGERGRVKSCLARLSSWLVVLELSISQSSSVCRERKALGESFCRAFKVVEVMLQT